MKKYDDSNNMPPESKLIDKYLRVARRHRAIMERRLSSTGVYRSQHRILMIISDNPNISQKELAEMKEVSTATIAVSLKKLEKGGYIKRLVDEKDNRCNQICITEKGKQIIEHSHQIFHEVDMAMIADFSKEEYRKLEEMLDRIYENLETYDQKMEQQKARNVD